MAPILRQEGVQKAYKPKNERDVQQSIRNKNRFQSLRKIAEEFGPPITYGDIHRVLHGQFPRGEKKRLVLGLEPLCPACKHPYRTRKRSHHKITSLIDMPDKELRWRFEHREEMK